MSAPQVSPPPGYVGPNPYAANYRDQALARFLNLVSDLLEIVKPAVKKAVAEELKQA
jgi:hypothetical protein